MSPSRHPGRSAFDWMWAAPAIAAFLVALVQSVQRAQAHEYPVWPPSPGTLALWSDLAARSLLVAGAVALALAVPWMLSRRAADPNRRLADLWALLAVGAAWAERGYHYNRYQVGSLWRREAAWGSAEIPAALLDRDVWMHNILLTAAAVVLAFLLSRGLRVALSRWHAVWIPRYLKVAAALAVVLLLLGTLWPQTWGRPRPTGPDIILISLDAVRADRLGCYGYPRETTPALDALAAEATRFTRAYCQEPWTLTSHMSMLTGLYPDAHGLDFGRALAPSVWTLSERLRDAGYRTGASVYDCFLLDPRFGFRAGFDHYRVDGSKAGPRTEAAAKWFLKSTRPTFLFLHFYDPHSDTGELPYEAAPEFRERLAPGDGAGFASWTAPGGASESLRRVNENELELSPELASALSRLYDAGLAETDAAVGAFLAALREAGRFEDALIIVVADHGEALGEQDHFMHEKLMEATLRVPLLVRWPKGVGRGVRQELVETVDLAPTVLAAAGLEKGDGSQGRVLLPGQIEGREVAHSRSGPDYALTTSTGWRLLYRFGENGPQLQALRRVSDDPADGPNVLESRLDVVDRWIETLAEFHRANAALAARFQGDDVVMSGADEELLRSLGYIE